MKIYNEFEVKFAMDTARCQANLTFDEILEKLTPMSNNKQSSVEYLIEQLLPKALSAEQFYHIQQSKAMHKEEIKNAYCEGWEEKIRGKYVPTRYYNETFGE